MDKDKVLIIQANIIMKPEELENWRYKFMKQKEEGVVLLPYNFSVVWASEIEEFPIAVTKKRFPEVTK